MSSTIETGAITKVPLGFANSLNSSYFVLNEFVSEQTRERLSFKVSVKITTSALSLTVTLGVALSPLTTISNSIFKPATILSFPGSERAVALASVKTLLLKLAVASKALTLLTEAF